MAKKKQQMQKQNQKTAVLTRQSPMEDSSDEKLQNLKSLNQILLKKTMEYRQQIESLVHEKILLRDELRGSSDENFMMKFEMDLFKGMVDSFVKENSNKLSCDITQLKGALALVEAERNNTGKALEDEKKNRLALKEKVVELEKRIEASGKELEKIKAEKGILVKEKIELENRSESLRNEKGTLHKDILELKKANGVLESAGTNAKRCLTMLKSVSSLVCGLDNKKGEPKQQAKGMDPYSVELEAIKKAFKNKGSVVEEMEKEVEKMKQSMEDAHKKKKRFWTLVSSITSLFMAASVAYAVANK